MLIGSSRRFDHAVFGALRFFAGSGSKCNSGFHALHHGWMDGLGGWVVVLLGELVCWLVGGWECWVGVLMVATTEQLVCRRRARLGPAPDVGKPFEIRPPAFLFYYCSP